MAYNLAGALAEGYTPTEIAEHLAKVKKYDITGARAEGYSDNEIATHLAGKMPKENKGFVGDLGTDLKRGVLQIPSIATGVVDLINPMTYITDKASAGAAATKLGELTGFQPSKMAEEAQQEYSPQRQQVQQEIEQVAQDPNASALDLTKAYLTRPSAIAGLVAEALPSTAFGGVLGRGLSLASKAISPAIGVGAGEGVITAGAVMDQATQGGLAPEDARRKAAASLGAGTVTGVIGGASAKLANRLGIVDPESIFNKPAVQALTETEINTFMNAANRGIGSRIGIGAVKEGLLEELPQSAQEQMWQNYSERKPIMEGVTRSAVEGALAGSAMGGGFNAISKGMSSADVKTEVDRRTAIKANEIKVLQERMATEAMGGTRESRPQEAALAAQTQEDKMGRENVRTELARPIYQTKEEVTAVLDKLREVYPELDQTQLNQTRLELQRIRDALPTQAEAAKALAETKPTVAPPVAPTAEPIPAPAPKPEVNPLVIDDNLLQQWGVTGRATRNALKEYSDLTNPEHVQQVLNILQDYPRSNTQRLAAQQGLAHIANLPNLGAPSVQTPTTETPASPSVQDSGAYTPPVGQGAQPSVVEPVPPNQPTPEEVAEPQGGGVDVSGGLPVGDDASVGASTTSQPSTLAPAEKFPRVDATKGINMGPGGLLKPNVVAEGSSLFHETNIDGLNNILYTDRDFDTHSIFVSNNPDLAIGQGGNKGIKVEFRPNSISGAENVKPGTAGAMGDMTGREYKSDIIAPRAVSKITVPNLNALKGIRASVVKTLQSQFDRVDNADGSITFTRKGLEPVAVAQPVPAEIEALADEQPIEINPTPEDSVPKRNLLKDIKRYQVALAEVDPEIAKDVDDLIGEYNEAKRGGRKGGAAAPQLANAERSLQTWMEWANSKYPQLNLPSILQKSKYTRNPTSVARLNDAFARLFTPNLLAVKPPNIFATYEDIPGALGVRVRESKGMAFVTPSNQQEHYIAEAIPRGEEIATILHEKGGHLGMPKLLGRNRLNALSARISAWAAAKDNKLENKIAREAVKRATTGNVKVGSELFKEESVAYFADLAVHKFKIDPLKTQPKEFAKVAGWLRELWNGVLSSVRKLQYNPEALTAHEVVSMVYGAARIEMHEDYQGRPNVPAGEATTAEETADEPSMKTAGVEPIRQKKIKKPTPQETAEADAAGRQFYEDRPEPTFKERVKATVGSDFAGWLVTKLVGGGEALALKGIKMFGPEARLNPVTGKELGYLNYHRALHDNDLATGAAQYGYLEMDKEGVIHIRDSADNVVALNGLADAIKNKMMADGMTAAAADDAFAHMALTGRFKELQQMGILSDKEFNKADHAYGKEMKEKYASEYQNWNDMYQRIRARTMDIMVKSGTFSPKKAKEFLDRLEYIPFNREQDVGTSDAVYLRSLLSAKAEYHIKGSDRSVKNVMDNIVDNQVFLMKRAVRNNASNLIAETMEYMHNQNPLMGGFETSKEDKSPNVISYLKDGELTYFKVLDRNDAVIFAAAPSINNTAIRLMRMFTGYLRKGVTLMPSFHYGQIIQDAMRAPAVAGTKAGMAQLLRRSLPEFAGNIRGETVLAKSLRRAGIIGQIDYQDTYDNWRKETMGKERTKIGKILEGAERIAQSNDLATRAAVYDDIIKEGGSENDASLRALMMINFQNRGHSQAVNTLMAAVPFVNSRIQGEYRLIMALTGRIPGVSKEKAKQLIIWRVAKMAAFTALYAMVSSGDDDYERAGEEVKNRNFLIGGFKFPVAPEFLALKVGVEKAYRLATDQEFETGAKAARAELSALGGLLIGMGDMTPTMIKPLIENTTNYSFFSGNNLVGFNQLSKDVNLRFNEGSSEFSKGLSNMMQEVGGNTFNISPIKMDNLIRGWFGTMGRDFLHTVDMLVGDKPAAKWNQLPLAGGVFYDMEGGALKSDFYDLKDESDRAYSTFNDIKKNNPEKAQEYYNEHKPLLAVHSRLDKIGDYINETRKQKQYVTKLDPSTARDKISEIDTRVHEMLKQNLPTIQKYLDEQDGM